MPSAASPALILPRITSRIHHHILAFHHFVERHQLAEGIFKTVGQYLREKGLLLREGTVVDATIIHVPTSTNK